jgi:hypothetical protein
MSDDLQRLVRVSDLQITEERNFNLFGSLLSVRTPGKLSASVIKPIFGVLVGVLVSAETHNPDIEVHNSEVKVSLGVLVSAMVSLATVMVYGKNTTLSTTQ